MHPRPLQETFEDADDSPEEDDSDLGDMVTTGGVLILCRTFGNLAFMESGLVLAITIPAQRVDHVGIFRMGWLDETYFELVGPQCPAPQPAAQSTGLGYSGGLLPHGVHSLDN